MKNAAGYLVKVGNKFLLGHPFGRDKNRWTIFKGGQNDGESLLDTAIRELREESNIRIVGDNTKLGIVQSDQYTKKIHIYNVGKEKIVHVFLLDLPEGALNGYPLKCPSIIPNSSDPEIDGYKLFSVDEAEKVLLRSQQGLITIMKALTKKD